MFVVHAPILQHNITANQTTHWTSEIGMNRSARANHIMGMADYLHPSRGFSVHFVENHKKRFWALRYKLLYAEKNRWVFENLLEEAHLISCLDRICDGALQLCGLTGF